MIKYLLIINAILGILKFKLINPGENKNLTHYDEYLSNNYYYINLKNDLNDYFLQLTLKSSSLIIYNKFVNFEINKINDNNKYFHDYDYFIENLWICLKKKNNCNEVENENLKGFIIKYVFSKFYKSINSKIFFAIDKNQLLKSEHFKKIIEIKKLSGVLGLARNDLSKNYNYSFIDNLVEDSRNIYPIFEIYFEKEEESYIVLGYTIRNYEDNYNYYNLKGLLNYEIKALKLKINNIEIKFNNNFIIDFENYYCSLDNNLFQILNKKICENSNYLKNELFCESSKLKEIISIDKNKIDGNFKIKINANLFFDSDNKYNSNIKYFISLYIICENNENNGDEIKFCLNFKNKGKNILGNSFFWKKRIIIDKFQNKIGFNISKEKIRKSEKISYNNYNEVFYIFEFVQNILYFFVIFIFLVVFYEILLDSN